MKILIKKMVCPLFQNAHKGRAKRSLLPMVFVVAGLVTTRALAVESEGKSHGIKSSVVIKSSVSPRVPVVSDLAVPELVSPPSPPSNALNASPPSSALNASPPSSASNSSSASNLKLRLCGQRLLAPPEHPSGRGAAFDGSPQIPKIDSELGTNLSVKTRRDLGQLYRIHEELSSLLTLDQSQNNSELMIRQNELLEESAHLFIEIYGNQGVVLEREGSPLSSRSPKTNGAPSVDPQSLTQRPESIRPLSIRLVLKAQGSVQNSKLILGLYQKLEINRLVLRLDRESIKNMYSARFSSLYSQVEMNAWGVPLPELLFRSVMFFHELHHTANIKAARLRRPREYYGWVRVDDEAHSPVVLSGYKTYFSFDEVSAYKKTVLWSEKGLSYALNLSALRGDLSEDDNSPLAEKDLPRGLWRPHGETAVRGYSEYLHGASQSVLATLGRIKRQWREFPQTKQSVRFRVEVATDQLSAAMIPLMDQGGNNVIGEVIIGLIDLHDENRDQSWTKLENYLDAMTLSAHRDLQWAEALLKK